MVIQNVGKLETIPDAILLSPEISENSRQFVMLFRFLHADLIIITYYLPETLNLNLSIKKNSEFRVIFFFCTVHKNDMRTRYFSDY